jgi:hypothetical protein
MTIRRIWWKDLEFEASLGYIVKPQCGEKEREKRGESSNFVFYLGVLFLLKVAKICIFFWRLCNFGLSSMIHFKLTLGFDVRIDA